MHAEGGKVDETDPRPQCLPERHIQLQGVCLGNAIVDVVFDSAIDKLHVKTISQPGPITHFSENGMTMQNSPTIPCEQSVDDIWLLVREFHMAFRLPTVDGPQLLPLKRVGERSKWMREELDEFESATSIGKQADAMIDLIYLAVGTLVEIGVPPGRVFSLVHTANMGKLWPDGVGRIDSEGKVLKPPEWVSPDPSIEAYVQELSSKSQR